MRWMTWVRFPPNPAAQQTLKGCAAHSVKPDSTSVVAEVFTDFGHGSRNIRDERGKRQVSFEPSLIQAASPPSCDMEGRMMKREQKYCADVHRHSQVTARQIYPSETEPLSGVTLVGTRHRHSPCEQTELHSQCN